MQDKTQIINQLTEMARRQAKVNQAARDTRLAALADNEPTPRPATPAGGLAPSTAPQPKR